MKPFIILKVMKKKNKNKNKHINNNSLDLINYNNIKLNIKDNNNKYNKGKMLNNSYNHNKNYQKRMKDYSSSIDKPKTNLLFKSSKNKNKNTKPLDNSRRDNTPCSKKMNMRKMILSANDNNKSFANNKTNSKRFIHNINGYNNNYNNYKKFNCHYNNILNDSYYYIDERSRTINKKIINSSFDFNNNISNINNNNNTSNNNNISNNNNNNTINNNNENSSIKINKYYEKFVFPKKSIIYNPRLYKGPIDFKNLIISNKIDEIFKELTLFLYKNKIHYQMDKNNKCRLICKKDDDFFEIEIYLAYKDDIENHKNNNKLLYFTYISKNKNKLALKSCLDLLNKSFLHKFWIKNYYDK